MAFTLAGELSCLSSFPWSTTSVGLRGRPSLAAATVRWVWSSLRSLMTPFCGLGLRPAARVQVGKSPTLGLNSTASKSIPIPRHISPTAACGRGGAGIHSTWSSFEPNQHIHETECKPIRAAVKSEDLIAGISDKAPPSDRVPVIPEGTLHLAASTSLYITYRCPVLSRLNLPYGVSR